MTELSCSLTSTELNTFAEVIFSLGQAEQSPREIVAYALLKLTGAERLASYRWDRKTARYYEPLLINLDPSHGHHYINELQEDDPITPKMRRHTTATRVEDVVPLKDFEQLDFYNEFLRPDDMYHGLNAFVRIGNDVSCDFRIFRGRSSPAFTQRELLLTDAISSCFIKSMDQLGVSELDVLTARERDIADLVARGCTDADIKRILDISFSTVRTHMTRCFYKLGCSNRSELAAFVSQRCAHRRAAQLPSR